MEIDGGSPIEGRNFRFTVIGGVGVTKISVRLNGKVIYEDDCPDPPCHEEMRVPSGSGGSELVVIAKDSTGGTLERKFFVERTEGEASGGAMTA
jgi:hypothetical protein